MNHRSSLRDRQGVSLVELMIGVATVGILVAVAFPESVTASAQSQTPGPTASARTLFDRSATGLEEKHADESRAELDVTSGDPDCEGPFPAVERIGTFDDTSEVRDGTCVYAQNLIE